MLRAGALRLGAALAPTPPAAAAARLSFGGSPAQRGALPFSRSAAPSCLPVAARSAPALPWVPPILLPALCRAFSAGRGASIDQLASEVRDCGRDWRKACSLVDDTVQAWSDRGGVVPDARFFNAAISVCKRSGRVAEAQQLFDVMCHVEVWPNVITYNMLVSVNGKQRRWQRALELLDLVGLAGFESRYPSELSGGMQQRVALCRALVHDAKLLLMDEPFGALDELKRMEMHDLLLSIRERTNVSVLFVTHSISEAIYLSDTVAVFSTRPSTICETIEVMLPYPRQNQMRYGQQFNGYELAASRALGIVR